MRYGSKCEQSYLLFESAEFGKMSNNSNVTKKRTILTTSWHMMADELEPKIEEDTILRYLYVSGTFWEEQREREDSFG